MARYPDTVTVNFKFLRKKNLQIGYCLDPVKDDIEDYTLLTKEVEQITLRTDEAIFFAVFGSNVDILRTPIAYIVIDDVTYSTAFTRNTRPYTDPLYYIAVMYQSYNNTITFGDWSASDYHEIPFNSEYIFNVDCGGAQDEGGFDDNTISGAVGIYKVTNQQLTTFLRDRYSYVEIGDWADIYDVSKDIIKLYKTPISDLDFDETEIVTIGGKNAGITCPYSTALTIEHETDNILLSGLYRNVLDKDTVIKIVIPFYGVYELDSKYINHNLKLKFVTNLLNNTTTCYIYIDNIIIDDINFICGYDIPYINNNINADIANNKTMTDLYIVFEDRIKIADIADTLKINTTINDEINNNNLSGYIKCNDIKTDTFHDIPAHDIETIIYLLKDYIFI